MGNNLDKPDFKQLSRETNFSTKQLSEWFKNFSCKYPNGKVDRTQFITLHLDTWGPDGDATDFCEHAFRQFDQDGNGFIDFREFMVFLSIASKGSATEKLQWAFKLYDMDGDGFLSENEIIIVLTAIYKFLNRENPDEKAKETTKKAFVSADDNRDGRISETEFVAHAIEADAAMKELLQGF